MTTLPRRPAVSAFLGLACLATACLALTSCSAPSGPGPASQATGPAASSTASTATSSPVMSAPATASTGASATAPSAATSSSAAATPSSARRTPSTQQDAPSKVVDAGRVTDTATRTVHGSGETTIRYTRRGDFAAVVRLDCSACRGATHVTGPGRIGGFIDSVRPVSGSFLMTPLADAADEQQVWIRTKGSWTVSITSWNTLWKKPGPLSGTGPAVVWVQATGKRATFTFTPAHSGDVAQVRWFKAGADKPYLYGTDQKGSETVPFEMPGVMSVQAEGSWKLTPHG